MKELLRLTLLGPPQILLDDRPLTDFSTNKAQALLFYLAVAAHPGTSHPAAHSRDALATLLWGEMTDARAKKNLRTVLPELRRLVGDHLQIERQSIAFDPTRPCWLDVAVFQRDLTPGPSPVGLAARQAAVDLYRDEFLSGFYVNNAPHFEEWVLEQRQRFHILAVEALFSLVSEYVQAANYNAALTTNHRLLLLEPWSEPAHRQQMLILARRGDRSAALAQFQICRDILAAEFGVEPLAETIALYEQIRTGALGETATTNPAQELVVKETGQRPTGVPSIFVNERDLPQQIMLFGRQRELERLQKWVSEEGCRLVGIFGMGGQGKSALAAALARSLAEPSPAGERAGARFQQIIWKSLLNAPPLAEVMQEWVYALSGQTVTNLPPSLDQQFSQLLHYLRQQRALLILDNLESLMQSDGRSGIYRPGYAAYGQLIRYLAEREHRSCLLLTGRERPQDLTAVEKDLPAVRFLSLPGLSSDAGRELLAVGGVGGDAAMLTGLTRHYSGNPLALKLIAETIGSLFAGSVNAFLEADAGIFDDIRDVLDQQFARLTPLEREIMGWLAIGREPVSFPVLRNLLAQPPASRLILEAIRSLQRHSLLENYGDHFGLQNVVLEYTTAWLVDNICQELINEGPPARPQEASEISQTGLSPSSFLNAYALILAQAKEYVRASQTRLLLQPVAEQLVAQLGARGAEHRLQGQLVRLRTAPPGPGYAAANLLHLLLQLGANLHEYDFSQLYFRQLYLRGASLPQTNFARAEIVDSAFTEPFGLIYTAVFSLDGQYVAASTSEGAIYIWRTADQQLAQVIQAHQHAIKHMSVGQWITAEGERCLVLASASDDKSVGIWVLSTQGQVRRHVRLAHPQQEAVVAVDLHPNGQRVTSVDIDGRVFVWDIGEHQNPQLVHHFATAFTRIRLVAFSRDGQTVVIGHRDGTVRLWQTTTGKVSLQLAGTTGLIFTLALSQDGQMLATGGREGHLSFWRLPTGELHQVIETKAGAIRFLAFSPDGKFLASGHHEDLAIRLWAIDARAQLHLQRTLLGHTQTIWSIAFDPAPAAQPEAHRGGNRGETRQRLVTGSSDHTVRVWDAETGHTLYMLRGQPRVLAAHTVRQLPPTLLDGQAGEPQTPEWVLAAAGYDQLIHLWQGQGNAVGSTRRVLRGARGPLYAVAISPDGRSVVAGGYDRTIYLWDWASGQLRQTFGGHTNSVYALAFHPDGKLLASGSGDGTIRLWLVPETKDGPESVADGALVAQPVAVLQADLDVVHDLAFSPNGRFLARGGSDRLLRLWDMTQRHYPELVAARRQVQDESEEDIFAVAFSPDGSKVACSGNHLIHIVDVANGTEPLILQRHTAWIYSIAFSPDGELLASSSADCTVCLWQVATGTLRAVLRGHREAVYKVAFTPEGTMVVSSSFDGSLKFWDSQTGECVNTLAVEGPYIGMNITGLTGVTQAQTAALKALGAVEL